MAAHSLLALVLGLACASCADLDGEPLAERAGADGGAELSLEWVLVDRGEPVSCVAAGASELELSLYFDASEVHERVSCFGGIATVGALPAGAATVEVALLDPAGRPLVSAAVGTVELAPGTTTPLGAVELVVPR